MVVAACGAPATRGQCCRTGTHLFVCQPSCHQIRRLEGLTVEWLGLAGPGRGSWIRRGVRSKASSLHPDVKYFKMIYKIKKREKKRTLKIIFGLEIDFAFRNDFA